MHDAMANCYDGGIVAGRFLPIQNGAYRRFVIDAAPAIGSKLSSVSSPGCVDRAFGIGADALDLS